MKPEPILNEKMYEESLAYVETLMDAAPGSSKEEELKIWASLVSDYEKKHYPIN